MQAGVVTSEITQYAVECPLQCLRVAFVDADLVAPVSVVLVVVQQPHRLHLIVALQLVCTGTTASKAPLSGSCVSTRGTTVGIEPRRRSLGSTTHLHSWTVLVEQTSQNATVELSQVVSRRVRQSV